MDVQIKFILPQKKIIQLKNNVNELVLLTKDQNEDKLFPHLKKGNLRIGLFDFIKYSNSGIN